MYASPGTIAAYRKSGDFPDDAELVKEVRYTTAELKTTGIVSHANKLKGWFVMMNDSNKNATLTISCAATAGVGHGLTLPTSSRITSTD